MCLSSDSSLFPLLIFSLFFTSVSLDIRLSSSLSHSISVSLSVSVCLSPCVCQPPCSNSDSQWVLNFLQKDSVHRLCAMSVGLLFTASQSVPCLCFCGDYEELLTAIQGGVVENCNVDWKWCLRCTSLQEWLAGFWFFRNTCDDTITGACSSGLVLFSTFKISVERGAC